MIPIAVCADDYAQNAAISAGILNLLDQKALSAASCFSTAPSWREQAAPALRERMQAGVDLHRQADIGLHFNLTEGFGGSAAGSLNGWILRGLVGELNRPTVRTMIATTLQRQLDAFEQGVGRTPDFIDGHQHVHQFRGVRDLLLDVVAQRYPQRNSSGQGATQPWIRNTVRASRAWRGKAQVLERLGGSTLANELLRLGYASNHGFAGVYGFDRADYGACFDQWLKAAQPGMLIMCHPANRVLDSGPPDLIAAQRVVEHRYFTSSAYTEALHAAGVQVQRLSDLLP
ncbi:ChbG/HpnK family deacetylase [Hylemonella sp. W303a]|uniref:ChbG/HpnK family deacetylase n=1 Tax=Hylemonella sp. W303a TaxID=3389873 RepID=UPI00396B09E2